MIGRSHDDYIAWKQVELHQQEGDDTLDLASLMDIAAFLANGIELIEKQHARHVSDIFEKSREARVGLAKVCAYQSIVAYSEKRNGDRLGDAFRERGLSVTRWPRQQYAMPRLHSLRPQKIGAVLFLDELPREALGG